jgi:hypothetical protein
MVRITSKKQQKNRRARTKKQRQFSEKLVSDKPTPPSYPAMVESHRFMSSMTFDGKTLTTKTQKDNEPAVETIYTKKQLAEEIPIGNKMVDLYLDGKMPKKLQRHVKGNSANGVFRNVLISPADLGLLPPGMNHFKKREADTLRKLQRPRIRRTRYRVRDREYNDGLRMIVDDADADAHGATSNRKKHIFDLPY